jgi:hypothetical protein
MSSEIPPPKKISDIDVHLLQPPRWDSTKADQSLAEFYVYAEKQAQSAIDWYVRNKKGKQVFSYSYRYASILLTAAGGLVPLLGAAWLDSADVGGLLRWHQWGFILIALAAVFVALDRYSGSSTGWMRYITALTAIQTLVVELRTEWPALLVSAPGDMTKCLGRLRTFSLAVRSEVMKETQEWVKEFAANLARLEEEVEDAAKKAREDLVALDEIRKQGQAGAVIVTIARSPGVDLPVTVSVDGEKIQGGITGDTCGVSNVPPGIHKVEISGTAGPDARFVSTVIDVKGGATSPVSLRL